MLPRFCYSTSITSTSCSPCFIEQLHALLASDKVQDICDQIKLLDGNDPDELARLKRQLPIITPHAQRFEGNQRKAAGAIPSGLTMLDIDHVDDPRSWFRTISLEQLAALQVYLVAITPSGHGLRIIAERQLLDLAADMQRLASALGFSSFDSCTKDLSRASFVMPAAYVLHIDESGLQFPDQPTADAIAAKFSQPTVQPSQPTGQQPQPTGQLPLPLTTYHLPLTTTPSVSDGTTGQLPLSPTTYSLPPTASALSHLVNLLGGEPAVGERNTFYFTLVRYARYICDFRPDVILASLPDFGLSTAERQSVITSAVNRPRKSEMPDLVVRALALAKAEREEQDQEQKMLEWADMPALPALPKPLQIICKKLPESFRPAMVIAALPVLGALATRVRFRYLDGAVHSFSFMSCVSAPAATGKSFIRTPINLLLTPIDEQDEIERQHEQDYKDALRAAKNSKNQPENPRACPRNNGINVSVAKLLQLLSYSDGKHLIGIGEEIDTLVKSERAGVWSQKSDIYRLGFDNAKYGQNYMSDNSFSANVPVFYNLLLTGTPGGMYRFFKDVEDGLVTRFCFAQLPDMFGASLPDFRAYTEAEEKEVVKYARMLDMAEGTIACPAVDKAIAGWLEEKRRLAIQSDSRAIDTIRRRSAVIGFRAGYLAALISGEITKSPKITKTTKTTKTTQTTLGVDFALWVAEYVFRNQMLLFGSQFEKVADDYQASVSGRGRVRKLLQSLPDTFTRSQLISLRARNGQTTEIAYVLTRWKQNGLIREVDTNTYEKI